MLEKSPAPSSAHRMHVLRCNGTFSSSCGRMLSQQSLIVRITLSCEHISAWSSTLLYKFFLSAFAKLRKATISFAMPVHPSVYPIFRLSVRMEQLRSHWTDFHKSLYLRIYRKYVEKFQVSLKSDKNKWYFIWRPIRIFYHISFISS
jgi:tRNA G10  N-methylase Trm11